LLALSALARNAIARRLFALEGTKEAGMNTRVVLSGFLLAALLAATAPMAARAVEEIKGGKWQFTTQMQMPAAPQSPSGVQPRPEGNTSMTRTACIDQANPVPADTQQGNVQCKLDEVDRRGSNVTWSMTCASPRGAIQSAGAARYTGDTMEATLTARIPGPNGQPMDTPGRITGRYLGACDAR
jgi:Protein of unknown function (DUF3617)